MKKYTKKITNKIKLVCNTNKHTIIIITIKKSKARTEPYDKPKGALTASKHNSF